MFGAEYDSDEDPEYSPSSRDGGEESQQSDVYTSDQMDIQVRRGTMNFLPVREINEKMFSYS